MGGTTSLLAEEPYFIHHGEKCLTWTKDNVVEFVDCGTGGTMDNKLWETENSKIKNLKAKKCLNIDSFKSIWSGNTDALFLKPCNDVKAEVLVQSRRLCARKTPTSEFKCASNLVGPFDTNPVIMNANTQNGIDVDLMLKTPMKVSCCTGDNTDKRCGIYKPGKSECDDVMEALCAPKELTPGQTPNLINVPICVNWCATHPDKCDRFKIRFCQEFPDHKLCDCINAADRPAIKAMLDKLPGASTGVPLPCFLQSRCSDTDPYNVFVPESVRKLQANCPSNLVDMAQLVDCSGATCYNVGAEQEAKLEKEVKPVAGGKETTEVKPVAGGKETTYGQTTTMQTSGSKRKLILYVMLFIVLIAIVIAIVLWPSATKSVQ